MRSLVAALALLVAAENARAQNTSPLGDLHMQRESRLVKYSSWDRTAKNDDFVAVRPGQTVTLADHAGAGIVRRWWITIAPRNDVAIQRQLIVRCYWDDEAEPSVEVPVSDFFGMGFGQWRDYVSLPLNMTSGGYNAYWPMPFRRRARITMENRSTVVIDRLYYNIDVEASDRLPDGALYFHAQFRRVTTERGQPVVIAEATGRGHYVGTLLSTQPRSGNSLWYLEGNERIAVDGETTPGIIGTGTEDYFSSGWYYDTGPYAAPYHGATIKDEATGRINAYRWHVEDPIPFRTSLRFTIEHGGTNDAPNTDYSSVAFWYQTHPHAPFPPLPADLAPIPVPAPRISGMIEGESLAAGARATAGEVRTQDMAGFFNGTWSGNSQLWWVLARPDARLTLSLRAPAARQYELIGYFTRAQDYGDVRVSVNGRALRPRVEGYSPRVLPTGPISFGVVPLRAGANTVVLEIIGKDPRAQGYSDGYLVGLDGFVLKEP